MQKIVAFLAAILFGLSPALAFASTITLENFDAYGSGDLQTVSSSFWTCTAANSFFTENTTYQQGTNGMVSTSSTAACGATISAETVGVFTVYLNAADINSTIEFRLRNGSSLTRVSIGMLNNAAFYRDSGGTGHQFAASLSIHQWHKFDIEVKTATDLYRVRVDGGTPTDWIGMQNAGATSITQIRFVPTSASPNLGLFADNITYDSAATLDTVAATVSSSGYSPSKEEFLFLIAIVLFLGSIPFWERTLSWNRQRYA